MAKIPKNDIRAAIKLLLKEIFSKHPTRNFNYKQVLRLLAQEHPVLYTKTFFDDDRNANRTMLNDLMYELVIDGDLLEVDRGKFKAVPVQQFIEGIIDITTTGVAYVMNDLFEDDIFIAPGHSLNAMGGDTVKVLLSVLEYLDGRPVASWPAVARYHHQYLPDVIEHEPGTFSPLEQQALQARGYRLKDVGRQYGNQQVLLWDKASQTLFDNWGEIGLMCRDIFFKHGLIMRACGDHIVSAPPLIISKDQIDELITTAVKCMEIFEQQLKERGLA